MTPDDRVLDRASLRHSENPYLYRLAKRRYANLAGVGAAKSPGRWNRLEEEAIYTSTEASLPLLERLVHTPKDLIPTNLAMMTIRFDGDWELDERLAVFPTLREARANFASATSEFSFGPRIYAVALPSVITPAWNVVLFPRRPGFWEHVSLVGVEAHTYDPRLFSEGAVFEKNGGAVV